MSAFKYRASVIIPSHQRAASLSRLLHALAAQDFPRDRFEVIVAADSCTDPTVETVQSYSARAPYRLRVVSHERKSASATRNFGAQHAEGATLIFLDDDIEPAPSLVRAHLAAQTNDVVTVGHLTPALPSNPSQWQLEARLWWQDQQREMRQPGHRFGYRDFFSGNCAMSADLFRRTGGFDLSFNRLEDYEFGFRLLRSGARLVYVPEAAGLHHDSTDLPQWIQRIRDEGVADVQLATRYPILRRKLFGSPKLRGSAGLIQRLAFAMRGRGNAIVKAGLRMALALERVRLRRRRNSVVYALRSFNYWRGVATSTRSMAAFTEWTEEETNAAVIAADAPRVEWAALRSSPRVEQLLAEGSRKGIRISINGIEALAIPAEPWSEPLRREHVDLALARMRAEHFVPVLASSCIEKLAVGGLSQL